MEQRALFIRSSIGTYSEDWFDVGFHQNTTLEIEIILEGRGLFEWPERKVFVETGHVVIIPPGIPHRFAAVTKVRFGVIHLQGMPASLREVADKLAHDYAQPRMYALSRIDRDRFEKLFREWLRVLASPLKEPQRTHAVWAELLLLYLHEHSQTDLQAMTITKAADFLRENLRQNVQVADLAELTGLTVAGFRRTFEKIYRLSPKQYQQQCRMQEAKWLLSATDKDLNEIAEQVGFHRLHSFSQWFKAVEGTSPSLWRKSQKAMHGIDIPTQAN
ncbi:helix-turn-helix transcriptional regulator [Paenibacillus mesophilus]|uniref:helix-turn-helix domain-containing protein n=1 Tax=Paenibacillus mesophilus TaxID=2582849 RepID=UPI00110F1A70|nr:AraC family transcriptional regulator [Paenibacillus mesophilus]TMV51576.1 helix-turn-helix transcriptional regulator [Paenibacillus mesophilus]